MDSLTVSSTNPKPVAIQIGAARVGIWRPNWPCRIEDSEPQDRPQPRRLTLPGIHRRRREDRRVA